MHRAGQTSPSELMNAVRRGRTDLGPLLAPYRGHLEALARKQVSPRLQVRQSPSDIVQETMLHACRDFAQFRGGSSGELWSWLKQILSRRILGAVRHHQGTAQRDLRREAPRAERFPDGQDRSAIGDAERFAASQTSPSGRVVRDEQRRMVREMVSGLPREYRRVLMLRIVAELPFDQIAERLERSPAAARQLYQRARQQLLARVQRQETQ